MGLQQTVELKNLSGWIHWEERMQLASEALLKNCQDDNQYIGINQKITNIKTHEFAREDKKLVILDRHTGTLLKIPKKNQQKKPLHNLSPPMTYEKYGSFDVCKEKNIFQISED